MPRFSRALARLWPTRRAPAPQVEPKGSATGPLIAWEPLGRPVWSPRDYSHLAREGFMQNPIVYRAVRMIAEAAATVPLIAYDGEHEIEAHPLLDLLRQPSLDHTSADFFESWYGFLLVSGNAYCEAVGVDGRLRELHVLRPDLMKVIPGADGWPEGFEYTANGQSIRLGEEAASGVRGVLHVKLFHPANDHYGMSPIEAAASAIDIHNAASGWNKALLDNAARPSGALVYQARDQHLTGEQFERLKAELEAGFQGAKNAGRPLLLEGGLDWKPLSLSPKDMDFLEAKNAAAREIALAIGVPPMLIGIPGDATYSNYQEASRVFWRATVLPLVERTAKAFASWLAPAWGGALSLRPDLDAIEALSGEREALWKRLEGASFLTVDEKRAAVGYGPMEASGEAKYSVDQPRVPAGTSGGGQWTGGGGGGPLLGGGGGDDLSNRYRVDLSQQDTDLGGHTIRDHVGKSDEELIAALKNRTWSNGVALVGPAAHGSFASSEEANDLINRVLENNVDSVDRVAAGAAGAILNYRFGFQTGKEAFRTTADSEPSVRWTYAVRVVLRHDARSSNGYKVLTAFPVNQSAAGN